MKKLLLSIILILICYFGYSQAVQCPAHIPNITFFYTKPLVTNQIIDTLFVCDPDVGQTHTWFVNDPSGFWKIDTSIFYPTHAYINAKNVLDVNSDVQKFYDIIVTVKDVGNFSGEGLTETTTVRLVEKNNTPVIASNQKFSINENALNGTIVGKVIASDSDANQTLQYSIIDGNINNSFVILQDGNITVSNLINYELVSVYYIKIKVQDNGTEKLSSENTITVNINDLNEAPIVIDQTF